MLIYIKKKQIPLSSVQTQNIYMVCLSVSRVCVCVCIIYTFFT